MHIIDLLCAERQYRRGILLMAKRPQYATHPLDEFWVDGTSVYCNENWDGENTATLLCECVSEYTAQGIADVLRYHNHVATLFSWTGPRPPKLRLVS
jgi:hypothetical protein